MSQVSEFWQEQKVIVTGGAGFLGGAVCRILEQRGCTDLYVPRRRDYDLTQEAAATALYEDHQPDVVLHLAAEVGGIGINRDQPGRFCYANLAMGMHLIEQARVNGIQKFLQVGTICSYPCDTPVPFKEEDLWQGYPEVTNAPYGIAKKTLSVMLEGYHQQYGLNSAVVLPVNLYGPRDNFDLYSSHVIPALIRKCLEAKARGDTSIECWGTGSASREFLYVEDAAEAIVIAAEQLNEPVPVNLGTGQEISIRDLVELVARLCEFKGEIRWDSSKPDGQPRRCLDTQRAKDLLGWQSSIDLEEGLRRTIEWYQSNRPH